MRTFLTQILRRPSLQAIQNAVHIPTTTSVLQTPPSMPRKRGLKKNSVQNSEPKRSTPKKAYKKQKISAALREQVWVQKVGKEFQAKCAVTWCKNTITVFDFQCGHDIPESKGGPTNLANLYPICGKCNLSMSNTYTFQEWCKLYKAIEVEPFLSPEPKEKPTLLSLPPPPPRTLWTYFICFGKQQQPTEVTAGVTDSTGLRTDSAKK